MGPDWCKKRERLEEEEGLTGAVGVVGDGSGVDGGGAAPLACPLEVVVAVLSQAAQAAVEVALDHALCPRR